MTDLRFWRDGARTKGACEERECGGVMMVVEEMEGGWWWCQCARCLKQAGVHPRVPAGERREPASSREASGWGF